MTNEIEMRKKQEPEKRYTLHVVPNYNPYDHFSPLKDVNGEPMSNSDGEELLYLSTNELLIWFKKEYPNGVIITKRHERDDGMIEFESRIYSEPFHSVEAEPSKCLGNGHYERRRGSDYYTPYSTAETLSKRKALNSIGYGLEQDEWLRAANRTIDHMEESFENVPTAEKGMETTAKMLKKELPKKETTEPEEALAETPMDVFALHGAKSAKSVPDLGEVEEKEEEADVKTTEKPVKKAKASTGRKKKSDDAPKEQVAEEVVMEDNITVMETADPENTTDSDAVLVEDALIDESPESESFDIKNYVITEKDVENCVYMKSNHTGKTFEEVGAATLKRVKARMSKDFGPDFLAKLDLFLAVSEK